MSTIEKDEAIVFGIRPYSETSCIVSWFARHHGRIHTLIKGAHRPKSGWLGYFNIFYTNEIIFYHKTSFALHLLKETDIFSARPTFRTNWRAAAAASCMIRLTSDVCPMAAPNPAIFDLIDQELDCLATSKQPELVLLRFEIQLLALAGMAPQLDACVQCRRNISHLRNHTCNAGEQHVPANFAFSSERGGLLCRSCCGNSKNTKITPELLHVLRSLQQPQLPSQTCSSAIAYEALCVMDEFLSQHLDSPISAHSTAVEIMARGRQSTTARHQGPGGTGPARGTPVTSQP